MNLFLFVLFTGALLWGASAGMIGVFMVLKRQSLVADALSHASLPGIVMAFLLTGSTHPFVLFCGACCAGIIALLFVMAVKNTTLLGYDALLGIIIALFYGSGIALLTYSQQFGGKDYAVLSKFLLGNITLVSYADVVLLLGIALMLVLVGFVLWKELGLISFDREYGLTLGYRVFYYDILFSLLLVAIVSTGMQIGGAVVTSALLVAPALTARYCSHSLFPMVACSAFFGGLATFCGSLLSYHFMKIPAGPAAVCCATFFLVMALVVRGKNNVAF